MSQKITSKNLSYSSSLPPFLAALHAQAAGASGPNPLAAAHRRHGRPRTGSEEAEDAPLVVDDQGNAVRVQIDGDGLVVDDDAAAAAAADTGRDQPDAAEKPEARDAESKVTIGGRKRKAGRVVGDSNAAGAGAEDDASRDGGPGPAGRDRHQAGAPATKRAKKAKKIKLSFDDDEG
ncbi:hypothetical protein CDD83_728 [Cordyceps sp. RAO-2017]|nr:hypothetical protein CDD83_728 [Cordyceps sp. RAO-2017]